MVNKKKRTCQFGDFSFLVDNRMKLKENEIYKGESKVLQNVGSFRHTYHRDEVVQAVVGTPCGR